MRYQPDRRSTGVWLRTDSTLKAELRRRAGLGLRFAQARAKVRTGRNQRSGHIEDRGVGGVKGDRMELAVVFDAPYSAARQFGNKRSRAEGFLTGSITIIERG